MNNAHVEGRRGLFPYSWFPSSPPSISTPDMGYSPNRSGQNIQQGKPQCEWSHEAEPLSKFAAIMQRKH